MSLSVLSVPSSAADVVHFEAWGELVVENVWLFAYRRSVHFKIIICFRLEILPELQHTSVEGGQIKDWEIRIKREDTVKVALSVQEKLKGMKYSTVKDRRQFYYTDLDTWFLKIE